MKNHKAADQSRRIEAEIPSQVDATSAQLTFPISVNYNLTLDEMMQAGNFEAISNSGSFEPFAFTPKDQTDILEVVLITFDHDLGLEKMIEETNERGYRPATFPELLALGAQHPDLQNKYFITTLGAVQKLESIGTTGSELEIVSDYLLPCLISWLGERTLFFGSFDGKYRPGCYFASIRK